MANVQNLIPNSMRSAEQVRENQRRGGINSGKARREKKLLKELCEEKLLEKMSNGKSMQENLITKAASLAFSDKVKLQEVLKFLEIMRDTAGQKPVDKVAQTNTEGQDITPVFNIIPVKADGKRD